MFAHPAIYLFLAALWAFVTFCVWRDLKGYKLRFACTCACAFVALTMLQEVAR